MNTVAGNIELAEYGHAKDDAELPVELIILLYKLKEVKTLIFQIQNANETNFSLFIPIQEALKALNVKIETEQFN